MFQTCCYAKAYSCNPSKYLIQNFSIMNPIIITRRHLWMGLAIAFLLGASLGGIFFTMFPFH